MDNEIQLIAEMDQSPVRLDHFLAARLPDWSRAKLQALIRAGAVAVNGQALERPSATVTPGAQVTLRLQPAPPSALEPLDIPLDILFEDNDLVVINKPAGLVVHPGAGERRATLVNALLHRYGSMAERGGGDRPGIVHRLDRFTSGVMVAARNDWTHQRLSEQFQARTVQKTYLALIHGLMKAATGEIDRPIQRDRRQRARMTTRRGSGREGRQAHTSYKVLEAFEAPAGTPPAARAANRFSWVAVQIHTGRTHQIRVHLSALGHPVVGDRLYGAAAALAGTGALAGLRPERVMLHAAELGLVHPRSGESMIWQTPLPSEIGDLLETLRRA